MNKEKENINKDINIRINNQNNKSDGFILSKQNDSWKLASRTLSYDAFKIYIQCLMLYEVSASEYKNADIYLCSFNEKDLGITDIEKAFKELINAGYLHRFGFYIEKPYTTYLKNLWDFFLTPINEYEYSVYLNSIG